MDGFEVISQHHWYPFAAWGATSHLLRVQSDTLLFTWCALGIIMILAGAARWCFTHYPSSIPGYLIGQYVRLIQSLIQESCGVMKYRYVAFFITLCTFLLICNCIIVIPFLEEPTKDLNTTFALGIVTFLFIQREMIRSLGIKHWIQEYFKMPLAVTWNTRLSLWMVVSNILRCLANVAIGSILLPIELVSKLSSVFSLSFRLFGNIFAGSIIASLWGYLRSGSLVWHIIGLSGVNLIIMLFFGVFEGCIQAAVFTMLGVSYLGRAIHTEE
jgi:F-type H+-transporting ATPase subunit a